MTDDKLVKAGTMNTVTFSFPIQSIVLPDGQLNETKMLAKAMSKMTDINAEYGYIEPEDKLLTVSFVDGDGEVLAVLIYEVQQEYKPGTIQLDDELGTTVVFKTTEAFKREA